MLPAPRQTTFYLPSSPAASSSRRLSSPSVLPRIRLEDSSSTASRSPRRFTTTPEPYDEERSEASMAELAATGSIQWDEGTRERMRALLQIHRVLYLGDEGPASKCKAPSRTRELEEAIDTCFEYDCVYDHPLARVRTRAQLSAHFWLLHLLASGSIALPDLSLGAWVGRATSLVDRLSRIVIGQAVKGDPEVGDTEKEIQRRWDKAQAQSWRLWEVSAECRDMGTMECYGLSSFLVVATGSSEVDGIHLAMIDQVITLSLLPTLTTPSPSATPSPSSDSLDLASLSLSAASDRSLASGSPAAQSLSLRLGRSLISVLPVPLTFRLPVHTLVEFNETNRATRLRDVVDVRDLVEAVVPGAKTFGWAARRAVGLMSASLGHLVRSRTLPNEESVQGHLSIEDVIGHDKPVNRNGGVQAEIEALEKAMQVDVPLKPDPTPEKTQLASAVDLPSVGAGRSESPFLRKLQGKAPQAKPLVTRNVIPTPVYQAQPDSESASLAPDCNVDPE